MATDHLSFSLRLANTGQFVSAISPDTATGYSLHDETYAVYVERPHAPPRRVQGWTDDGRPLVKSEHSKNIVPIC